jgi:hypothetical protein
MIRFWPLPANHPWFEEAWYDTVSEVGATALIHDRVGELPSLKQSLDGVGDNVDEWFLAVDHNGRSYGHQSDPYLG